MTAEPQLRMAPVQAAGMDNGFGTVGGAGARPAQGSARSIASARHARPAPAGGIGATARLYPSALSGGGWYVITTDTPEDGGAYAPPPAHMMPILEELLSGDTDVTVSRRLAMSPRTYSRRVAELLDYLGVNTRFQAGMEMALRGWVPFRRYTAKISEPQRRSQSARC